MAAPVAGGTSNVSVLFSELNRLGQNGEYERALKVANKVLQELPDDNKAFQCKVVCLIHLNRFDETISLIKKNTKLSGFDRQLVFEKAYCEYRQNRPEEALKTIKSAEELDSRLKELLGQVLYRLETFDECFNTYRDLLKNSQDDYEEERETNLSAVLAALQMWGGRDVEDLSLGQDTYETCYNAACYLIGKNQFKKALDKLKTSEELCRKNFEEDPDVNPDDMAAELAIIWVQMGYVLQKLGQNEEALKLYNQVVKQRPSDVALLAVASNNIITLNKDQNMFDSKKRIKAATSDNLRQKLSSDQRTAIAINECLLYMYMGQGDQCHHSAQQLQKSFPALDKPCLIEVAQFLREKNSQKAIELLQTHIEKSKDSDSRLSLKLALAQIYLSQEHIYNACNVLRSLGNESYRPGVVSALVALYLSQEDKDSAAEVLNQAVQWYQTNEPKSPDLLGLIRANANFHLSVGTPQMAAQMLEELRKSDSKDLKILAQLILAYSKFDPEKAQTVSKQFPPLEKLTSSIDVDSLESSVNLLGSKYIKKTTRVDASPRVNTAPSTKGSELVVKKKHKKKKKLLPKNFDPTGTPDPERWLPMRERTYYRGKRKNKKRGDVGKGTQGSVAPSNSENLMDASESVSPSSSQVGSPKPGVVSPSSSATTSASTANAAAPAGPRQQKPAGGAKQKPKKKKGGNKW